MSNVESLRRQHLDVLEIVDNIDLLIKKREFEVNGNDIAKNINLLAGKLNIHLSTEDKFMYPKLRESSDDNLRKLAEEYSSEMGHIFQTFSQYKERYNTRTKILSSPEDFKKDTIEVFKVLRKRINKEDKELYNLI